VGSVEDCVSETCEGDVYYSEKDVEEEGAKVDGGIGCQDYSLCSKWVIIIVVLVTSRYGRLAGMEDSHHRDIWCFEDINIYSSLAFPPIYARAVSRFRVKGLESEEDEFDGNGETSVRSNDPNE